MRQVGKSTVFEALRGNRKYVSLDDLGVRRLAKNDPKLFLKMYKPPVIIDEIQYAPELFPYIKMYVDEHRNENGLFWLTGSQKFSLMEDIQESLAGRVAILDMLGLSHREIARKPNGGEAFLPSMDMAGKDSHTILKVDPMDVYRAIFNGSFPRPIANRDTDREIFYRSYVQTYIERDVRDFHGITNSIKFRAFVGAVAVRTGNLLNYSDLSRDVDIDVRTVKLWLSILEKSGIIKLLYPYYANIAKRIIKTPKAYFLDTGLCVHLVSIDSPESLEASYMSGSILETYAFCEILKSYWHNGEDCNIYFYRDTDQKEIDFIIEKNAMLHPIEIKKTGFADPRHVRNFRILQKLKKPVGTGAVICLVDKVMVIDENNLAIPIWEI
jgi:predicted AAA+ superfamily ATPase